MSGPYNTITFFLEVVALSIIVVPLHYLIRRPDCRRLLLIVTGGMLLFSIAPRLLIFYTLYWFVIWILQMLTAATCEKKLAALVFWPSILVALAPMLAWKIVPFRFVSNFNIVTHNATWSLGMLIGQVDAVHRIILPMGLSFAAFRAADLLIQSFIGLQRPLTVDRCFLFGFFPPVQIIGPVIQYSEIGATSEAANKIKAEDLAQGAGKMLTGLFKVMVLALPLQRSTSLFSSPPDSVWKSWVLLVLFAWYLYLNFAGYSDMAIGAARLCGFRLKPNFNFSYFRDSLQGFWKAWHMSLTGFCNRNIFMLMGGYRKRMQYPAIFATMITIGLWHDIKWSFLLFGIYHATGLTIERLFRNCFSAPWPLPLRILSTVTTFLFVILSYPMVMLPVEKLIAFYLSLLGL